MCQSPQLRTSEHRTCTYLYDGTELVGSVEFEPDVEQGRDWAVYVANADNTGDRVARCQDRGAALVQLGRELNRRLFASQITEILTR